MRSFDRGAKIFNSERKEHGTLTGGTRQCQLTGCRGLNVGVRWPDGKLTWPCSSALRFDYVKNEWVII